MFFGLRVTFGFKVLGQVVEAPQPLMPLLGHGVSRSSTAAYAASILLMQIPGSNLQKYGNSPETAPQV